MNDSIEMVTLIRQCYNDFYAECIPSQCVGTYSNYSVVPVQLFCIFPCLVFGYSRPCFTESAG
uniref:Uncharacterized protein n=1 Tax=Anguilla anguilla TaxID=7936 RepID=A0A0E9SPG4_ANGAN